MCGRSSGGQSGLEGMVEDLGLSVSKGETDIVGSMKGGQLARLTIAIVDGLSCLWQGDDKIDRYTLARGIGEEVRIDAVAKVADIIELSVRNSGRAAICNDTVLNWLENEGISGRGGIGHSCASVIEEAKKSMGG